MIRESNGGNDVDTVDLILLEYSINGLQGMKLLLKRLQRRFPAARFVYVHLYALRMNVDNAVTGEKPRAILKENIKFVDADARIIDMLNDPASSWKWSNAMIGDVETVKVRATEMLREVVGADQARVFTLPIPSDPKAAFEWFGPDFHHLGPVGHSVVAQQVIKLIDSMPPPQNGVGSLFRGTWGKGDTCFSWYETGQKPAGVDIEGGTMKLFVQPDKWALHIGQEKFGKAATISFPNNQKEAQPFALLHMSWSTGVYPKARISLNGHDDMFDPLDPSEKAHVFHVTRTTHLGWALPQTQNVLRIEPVEETQRPLRVLGLVMCGACHEMDEEYLPTGATADMVPNTAGTTGLTSGNSHTVGSAGSVGGAEGEAVATAAAGTATVTTVAKAGAARRAPTTGLGLGAPVVPLPVPTGAVPKRNSQQQLSWSYMPDKNQVQSTRRLRKKPLIGQKARDYRAKMESNAVLERMMHVPTGTTSTTTTTRKHLRL